MGVFVCLTYTSVLLFYCHLVYRNSSTFLSARGRLLFMCAMRAGSAGGNVWVSYSSGVPAQATLHKRWALLYIYVYLCMHGGAPLWMCIPPVRCTSVCVCVTPVPCQIRGHRKYSRQRAQAGPHPNMTHTHRYACEGSCTAPGAHPLGRAAARAAARATRRPTDGAAAQHSLCPHNGRGGRVSPPRARAAVSVRVCGCD